MADQKLSDEGEKAIPVFTVLKNNAILKNIFLLDNPPPSLSEPQITENGDQQPVQEFEETLVVGRHPDCNIILEHPSISRFHLRIHSKPSSRELSVFDLSSVHGTWVSGKKIEAGVLVELKEGDTIRLGASSRVYRLHWVPLSRAYDMDNPFLPPLDNSMKVEETEEDETPELQSLVDDGSLDWHLIFSDENSKSMMHPLQSPGSGSEDLHLVFSDENSKSCFDNLIPPAPPISEYLDFLSFVEGLKNVTISDDNDVKKTSSPFPEKLETESDTSSWSFGVLGETQKQGDCQNRWPSVNREVLSDLRNSEISSGELGQGLHFPDSCKPPSSHQQKEKASSFNEDGNQISMTCFPQQPFSGESSNSSSSAHTIPFANCVGSQTCEENQNVEPPLGIEGLCGTEDLESPRLISEENYVVLEQSNISSPCEERCPNVEEVILQTIEDGSRFLIENHERKPDDILLEIEAKDSSKVNKSPQTPCAASGSQEMNLESHLTKSKQRSNIWSRRGKPSSVLQVRTGRSKGKGMDNGVEDGSRFLIENHEQKPDDILLEIEAKDSSKVNKSPQTPCATSGSQEMNVESHLTKSKQRSNIWSRRGKPSSVLQVRTGRRKGKGMDNGVNADVVLTHQGDTENSAVLTGLDGVEEAFTPDKENCVPSALKEDAGSSPVTRELFQSFDAEKESFTFTPDKENLTPYSSTIRSRCNMVKLEDSESCRSSSLVQMVNSETLCIQSDGEEVFTPDKENFSPDTLQLRSKKKMTKLQNVKRFDLSPSFRDARNPSSHLQEQIHAPSVKQKQVTKVLREQKLLKSSCMNPRSSGPDSKSITRGAERVPFQPLVNSGCMIKSLASPCALSVATISSNPLICGQTIEENSFAAGEKRRWNMVVDCSCLLNAESRKALHLLKGLKGTQLIIPRIVIRELDCLNRQGSIFRRKTEASYALDWIDECMVETKWWIHVQTSDEEGRPYAPTPPASPQSLFSGAASPMGFCTWGTMLGIVSPTAEDHILEYALHSRRTKTQQQLVLLSNDVTLKIKAMAEGLICETSEEFRESLVNPFSDRFLWKDSSPRGPTWTCKDDVVLKETFYSRMPSRSGAKGLKLILLNNARSRYAKKLEAA